MTKFFLVAALILAVSSACAAEQTATVYDWLDRGWRAESSGDYGAAFSAYSAALSLRPDDPTLNLKSAECLIFSGRTAEAAKYLVQAFDLIQKNPKSPPELKRYTISLLMGRMLDQFYGRGRIYPIPLATLPKDERKRMMDAVPPEWLHPDKVHEAFLRISIDEQDAGLALLKEAIQAGAWESVECPILGKALTLDQRLAAVKSWQEEVEKSDNPYLRLAVLDSYWQMQRIDDFARTFRSAVAAFKDKMPFLKALYYLCIRMKWQEGIDTIKPLLPPQARQETIEKALAALEKALDEKDRGDLVATILRIIADFADETYRIYGPRYLRPIMASGWTDVTEKLVHKDLLQSLPWETKNMLLGDAVYDIAQFDYWVRLFVATDRESPAETLKQAARAQQDGEKGIWLIEQAMRIFPKDQTLKSSLGQVLLDAGYHERALAVAQEALWEISAKGEIDREDIETIWAAATNLKRFRPVIEKIWADREKLALGTYLVIAARWYDEKKPDESAGWAEDAANKAETRGWASDAVKQAQAYGLQRSDPVSAETLLSQTKRTATLYSPETYEARLKYLLESNRKDDTVRVYKEAAKLYTNYSFTDRVYGLHAVVPMDWNAEVSRQSKAVLTLSQPASYESFVPPMMRLAYALFKADRAGEAGAMAPKVLPTRVAWQKGLPLAVELFRKRMEALPAFVEWARTVQSDPERGYGGGGTSRLMIAEAISSAGDPPVAFAYSAVSLFTEPKGSKSEKETEAIVYNDSSFPWTKVSQEDRVALKNVLAGPNLNAIVVAGRLRLGIDQEWRKLLVDLLLNQRSAPGLVMALRYAGWPYPGVISAEQRAQLTRAMELLDQATEWESVDWNDAHIGVDLLRQKGFTAEATRIAKTAIAHAPTDGKAVLALDLQQLTGETTAGGAETAVGFTGLNDTADTLWNLKKFDEARAAYLKAFDAAPNTEDRRKLASKISYFAPDLAMDLMEKLVPEFLVADPESGQYEYLTAGAVILNRICEGDDHLAPRAFPLAQKLYNASRDDRQELTLEYANISFRAGKIDAGAKALFAVMDGTADPLADIITAMLDYELPIPAYTKVREDLRKYLSQNKVGLSVFAEAMAKNGGLDPRRASVVTLKPFAAMLTDYISPQNVTIPDSFLKEVVHWAYELGWDDDLATPIWVELLEKTFRKAAQPPSSSATAGDALLKHLEFYRRWPGVFYNSDWYQRLVEIAESLKGGKL